MVQMNLQWDASTQQLSFAIPPMWSADTCVLFTGREVKRVEFHDGAQGTAGMTVWDSCNGQSVAQPTPIAGGYTAFDNRDAEPRAVRVRALHSGGVTCYVDHGPATMTFASEPAIAPRAICPGVEAATATFAIGEGDSIEIVMVIRADAERGGSARDLTEAIVRELLRERMRETGGEAWREVRRVA